MANSFTKPCPQLKNSSFPGQWLRLGFLQERNLNVCFFLFVSVCVCVCIVRMLPLNKAILRCKGPCTDVLLTAMFYSMLTCYPPSCCLHAVTQHDITSPLCYLNHTVHMNYYGALSFPGHLVTILISALNILNFKNTETGLGCSPVISLITEYSYCCDDTQAAAS